MPGAVADVADLRMVRLPKRPNGEVIDWSAPLRDAWDISESGALNIMEHFMSEGMERACCKPRLTQGEDRCRVGCVSEAASCSCVLISMSLPI